jgi:hypothetical protein
MGLFAKVARVHKEEDALGTTKLEQAVNSSDGSEGFACTGGHVDQGPRLVLCE